MPQIPIRITSDVTGAIKGIQDVQKEVQKLTAELAKVAATQQQALKGVVPAADLSKTTKAAQSAAVGVQQYATAQKQLQPVLSDTEKYLKKQHETWQVHSRGLRGFGADLLNMMQMQARWFTSAAILTAVPASIIKAGKDFANFEQDLLNLQTILGATDDEMRILAGTIRETGKTTVLSATEAAKAAILFAQTGLRVDETAEALQVAGKLMAMPGADIQSVVKSLSTVLHAFKYEAQDIEKIADVLAKSTDLAAVNIQDLGVVFNYLASQASLAGIRLEEMQALVVTLSRAGVSASTIGTGLSQFLTELIDMSPRLEKTLRSLGLDPEKFRLPANNIMDVLEQLQEAGIDITSIFEGMEVRSARALSSLVNTGTAELRRIQAELTNSGYLAQFFSRAMEGTENKARLLWNQIGDLSLSVGEGLNPAIKTAIEYATKFAGALAEVTHEGALTQKQLDEMSEPFKVIIAGIASLISGFKLLWYAAKLGIEHTLKPLTEYFQLLGLSIALLGVVLTGEMGFKEAWEEFKTLGKNFVINISKGWDEQFRKFVDDVVKESVDLNKKLTSIFTGIGRPEIPTASLAPGDSRRKEPPAAVPRVEIPEGTADALRRWQDFIKRARAEIIRGMAIDPIEEVLASTQLAAEEWLDHFVEAYSSKLELKVDELPQSIKESFSQIKQAIEGISRGEEFILPVGLDIEGLEVLEKVIQTLSEASGRKITILGLEREESILNLQKAIGEIMENTNKQLIAEKEILRVNMTQQLVTAGLISDEEDRLKMGKLIVEQYWSQVDALEKQNKFVEERKKLEKELQRYRYEESEGRDRSKEIRLAERKKELQELLEKGVISTEEYERSYEKAKRMIFGTDLSSWFSNFLAGWNEATTGMADTMLQAQVLGQEAANTLKTAFSDAFFEMSTGYKRWFDGLDSDLQEKYKGWAGYVEFLKDTADNVFQHMYQSFMRTLADMWAEYMMTIYKMLLIKAFSALGGFLSGGAGTMGAIGGMDLAGSAFAHEGGLVSSQGVQRFHGGGLITDKFNFNSLRRYHGGGLTGDEVPIIAQTGEGVLSRRGMANLATLNSGRKSTSREQSREQPQQVVNNYNINTIDAYTWRDYVRRNRGPVLEVISEDLKRAGSTRQAVIKYT